MIDKYTAPSFEADAFNCPHCETYAHQEWVNLSKVSVARSKADPSRPQVVRMMPNGLIGNLFICNCSRCKKYSLWVDGELVYPEKSIAPLPLDEMPDNIKKDFAEARKVVNYSPRSAGALLRVALENLIMNELEVEGHDLNDCIGNLVANHEIDDKLQKALDSLRVIGNESVHPGELDLRDDLDTALALFKLLNLIVEKLIVQPREIDELYEKLPKSKKLGIENRDKQKTNK